MELQKFSYNIEATQCSHITEHCVVKYGSLLTICIPSSTELQICRLGPIVQLQTVSSDTCFHCDAI